MSGRKLLADALIAGLAPDPVFTEQRRNWATNPVPVSTLGWNSNNGTQYPATYDPTGGRRAGTGAKKFTRTTNTLNSVIASSNSGGIAGWTAPQRVAATPGEQWTISAYVKSSVDFLTFISIAFFDAANVQIGSSINGATVAGLAGNWARPFITVTVPAGATNLGIFNLSVQRGPLGTVAVGGEEVWMTDALYERGTILRDYFDGNYSPDPAALAPAWVGAANASPSTLTSTYQAPLGWQVLSHTRQLDAVKQPGACVLWTVKRAKAPALGLGWFADEVELWVLTAATKPDLIEDDLDELLWQVMQALEPLDAFHWETVERDVLADTFDGYRMTITCCWRADN